MALAATLVVFVGMVGLTFATLALSNVEVRDSRSSVDELRARYLAESGVERARRLVASAIQKGGAAPLESVVALFDGEPSTMPFPGNQQFDGDAVVGGYAVTLTLLEQTAAAVTLRIDATGYLPDAPANLAEGEQLDAWHAVTTTVRYELEPSEVFDYAYFINNWGWFYGNTIFANGNTRSNGQFDIAGYAPTITGQPTYEEVAFQGGVASLTGYRDDNGDGLTDGNDGGVWSGWDIVGGSKMKGNGAKASNQHEYDEQVPMPNLSDLAQYEAKALEHGSKITIDGAVMTNAVYGDETGEKAGLYLVGTAAKPIVLDGPVVVDGDVIISGHVTGQGAIYASGNVYVPNSIVYVDGPSTDRPSSNSEADTEAWLTANWDKDFLGLFSAENIVVGDHTHTTWKSYVEGWMKSSLNKSEEDAGEDGVPNTKAGLDGILGTADDDVLEDDGSFTVEVYTVVDEELGLIPPGFEVGDTIPGSGEDIDGDGQYDDTTTLADIAFDTALNTTNWGGNMPLAGISKYSDIATLYAYNLDAVFYTNHSFCYLVLGSSDAVINGALVSRNENIVYGTPKFVTNYDCRLLGGVTGMAGDLLPQIVGTPRTLVWRRLDEDPNRQVAP
jgi:hypothetical protein